MLADAVIERGHALVGGERGLDQGAIFLQNVRGNDSVRRERLDPFASESCGATWTSRIFFSRHHRRSPLPREARLVFVPLFSEWVQSTPCDGKDREPPEGTRDSSASRVLRRSPAAMAIEASMTSTREWTLATEDHLPASRASAADR